MDTRSIKSGSQWCVHLSGMFNYDACHAFSKLIDQPLKDPEVMKITLDLAALEYLDSSALGALLILREKAMRAMKQVELTAAKGNVRKALEIANFNRLFSFS